MSDLDAILSRHIERILRAENDQLEALCEVAYALTDPDKYDRLRVIEWTAQPPDFESPPRTVACATDLGIAWEIRARQEATQ